MLLIDLAMRTSACRPWPMRGRCATRERSCSPSTMPSRPENIRSACDRYRVESFAGYVGVRDLDRISAPCS